MFKVSFGTGLSHKLKPFLSSHLIKLCVKEIRLTHDNLVIKMLVTNSFKVLENEVGCYVYYQPFIHKHLNIMKN